MLSSTEVFPKFLTQTMASVEADLIEANEEFSNSWNIPDEVSDRLSIPLWAARNTIDLLDQDHTIPFIARYRKENTGNMEADKLRNIKETYEELKSVQAKCASVMKTIKKLGKLTASLKSALRASRTLSEVEHLYQAFKPGNKRSYAERARELGLEKLAMKFIQNPQTANANDYVNPAKEGLKTKADVEKGVKHILADIIAKDKDVLAVMRKSTERAHVTLDSTKSRVAEKKKKQDENAAKNGDGRGGGGGSGGGGGRKNQDSSKFETYFKFSIPAKYAKPHQVLAINRGESVKALTVKINVPEQVKNDLKNQVQKQLIHHTANGYTRQMIQDSFGDSYTRLLHPLIARKFRSELTKSAEKASVEVFASNLKKLLLMPPVRGKVVLGVDPGFKHGCKWALTSETGKILDTGVDFLQNKGFANIQKLKEVLIKHKCETVAIGNGTACRETEAVFADYIKKRVFAPLNIVYCIVNESGASIYSASDLAKKEMPDLDVSLRGAVSIARRLQDPLAELVKIDPKHIGVGMYQHDVSESQLKTTLDSVVEECVSFVGVDLNVCSEVLLRRIAGLNAARAKKIIEWKEKNGPFLSREQLKSVAGIGPKTFEQCAGFVRILPETRTQVCKSESEVDGGVCSSAATGKKRKATTTAARGGKKAKLSVTMNSLDQTCIHPESYEAAEKLLQKVGLSKDDIGNDDFITKMKQFIKCQTQYLGANSLAAEFGVGQPTMELIIKGLTQPMHLDMREDFEKPLFKQGMTSIEDLKPGGQVTGRVTNITHFGAFVDIGVGKDALIHVSKMPRTVLNGKPSLELGDKVEVTILNIDMDRQRIQLGLKKLL